MLARAREIQRHPQVFSQAPTREEKIRQWMTVVRGEFLEVPGLLLTRTQIQRLWGLDADLCDGVLEALLQTRFLQRTRADAFVRP
jgi:hypothetical protein